MKSVAVILLWLAGTSMAWKLNVPRVLLPLADEGANFLVFSEGGCFTWSSTRPEVVKVAPTKKTEECGNADDKLNPILASQPVQIQDVVVSGCTSGALIKLPPRWGGAPTIAKTQAIVTAEDAHSDGHILRCDVIVDRIHRLQIVTKTLELFLEEAPEEFSVRAYDDQGNEFSTLEGIVFIWTVESSSNKGENVKFIKFRDSTYALEPSLMALEAKGQQGSKVLLEGIRTGSSKVSVRIASKAYAEVPPAEVTVMVVANLFLVPHTSFVIFGATVDYHAEQMKSNRVSY
jgi:nuclear pore complex protein Nup210